MEISSFVNSKRTSRFPQQAKDEFCNISLYKTAFIPKSSRHLQWIALLRSSQSNQQSQLQKVYFLLLLMYSWVPLLLSCCITTTTTEPYLTKTTWEFTFLSIRSSSPGPRRKAEPIHDGSFRMYCDVFPHMTWHGFSKQTLVSKMWELWNILEYFKNFWHDVVFGREWLPLWYPLDLI